VARLASVLDAAADCAAAGGSLVGDDGQPQHGFHVRRFPTLATWTADLWLIDRIWPGNPASRRYRAEDQTRGARLPVEVDQPAAACLMVRRDVFDAIGGMDERFHPAWFEDVDFCRRLRDAGHRILFVPDAAFVHTGGVAMRHLGLREFSRVFYRNMQRYARKHHGPLGLLASKALIVTGMLLRAAIVLPAGRRRDAGAYLAVAWDALARWRL
jgi:GT2 family glycosyltransferase